MIDQIYPGIAVGDSVLLSKREVAARLRISPRTLDQWMRKKRVPYLKISKSVRFHWPAVLQRLNEFRVG
jgi:Helix-turn-helix domain